MVQEERLDREAIRNIQERAWARTFRYALENSPFYRKHLRDAGLGNRRRPKLEDIRSVPPVSRAELSARNEELLCVPKEKVIDIVTTSGTTGRPLLYMLTENDLRRLAYNEYLSFRCAGLTPSDTVLLGVTLDRCFIAGMAYWLGLRMLGCKVVRVGSATPAMHLDMISRLSATAIVSVPSFLEIIASRAQEAGTDLSNASVRKAICIGEPVRTPDFALNAAAARIERAYGAKVYSTYASTEMATSLCECDMGAGGHIHPELLHIEILDDAGNPVSEGEVGEVVATTFGIEGMPIIRYRTGDCAAFYASPCRCGRLTPRIGPIVGRKDHKLKVKGTTVFPSALQLVLDSTPGVGNYVIVATSAADLSDSVEVLVHFTGDEAETTRRLREGFQGNAKISPVIRRASREEIEALQMPEGSRKRRLFVDRRRR
ncbi:MAG: AMP-binding protein [Planctomycetota bacterium]|nr:AMP-binding protein [Planctomycetota bacterium]